MKTVRPSATTTIQQRSEIRSVRSMARDPRGGAGGLEGCFVGAVPAATGLCGMNPAAGTFVRLERIPTTASPTSTQMDRPSRTRDGHRRGGGTASLIEASLTSWTGSPSVKVATSGSGSSSRKRAYSRRNARA